MMYPLQDLIDSSCLVQMFQIQSSSFLFSTGLFQFLLFSLSYDLLLELTISHCIFCWC
jgi:hypothetical protein